MTEPGSKDTTIVFIFYFPKLKGGLPVQSPCMLPVLHPSQMGHLNLETSLTRVLIIARGAHTGSFTQECWPRQGVLAM